MQFTTSNESKTYMLTTQLNKLIQSVSDTKFLGIYINDTINWKNHIDHILPKLSIACHAMRNIKPFISLETLRMVYHSAFHSVISYGLFFWGISPHSKRIFLMQKIIVRIMMGCRRFVSCRNLFKNLKLLPLMSQYIFSLMMFIIKHKHHFTANSAIHNKNTRKQLNFHQPAPNFTGFKHGNYYSRVKIYNILPSHIKQLSDDPRSFELKLKEFLYHHSYYSLEEYFNH